MKTSEKIKAAIKKIPMGETFKYRQLGISKKEYGAAAKAIERLIAKKKIKRISTGVFYKPKKTVFGEIKPGEEDLLRPYLFAGKKRVAYITGTALYNKMGLTTQVPKDIKVSSKAREVRTKIGNIKIRRVKSYVDVTDGNFRLLEILDAFKDFKQIPDLDKEAAIKQMTKHLANLKKKELLQLVRHGLEYPPRTRAFLGALLDNMCLGLNLRQLGQSLSPLTVYDLRITQDILPTAKKWNIK